jgi:hypothetical protein
MRLRPAARPVLSFVRGIAVRRTIALLVLMPALLLASAAGAAVRGKVIAHGTTLTGGKIAYAKAGATAPRTLAAKVTAAPPQTVKIQYSISCTTTNTFDPLKTSIKSDQFSAKTPVLRKLTLPLAKPKLCNVSVYSTLSQKGKQTLEIVQD